MFTRWKISNFKSIREPVELEMAPLTIFSGVNSSGKSTLMQSILMVAQSFSSVVNDEALVLNGRFLQLGRLQDILHHDNKSQTIQVGFDWLPAEQLIDDDSLVLHLDARIIKGTRDQAQGKRTDRFFPCLAESIIGFERIRHPSGRQERLSLLRVHKADKLQVPPEHHLPGNLRQQIEEGAFNYTITNPGMRQLVADPRQERAERVGLTNLVPTRLLVAVDTEFRQLTADIDWIIGLLGRKSTSWETPEPRIAQQRLSKDLQDVFRLITLNEDDSNFGKKSGKDNYRLMNLFKHAVLTAKPPLTRGFIVTELGKYRHEDSQRSAFRPALAAALVEYLSWHKHFTPGDSMVTYEERLLPVEYMNPTDQICRIMREQLYVLGPLRDEPRVIYDPPLFSERWSVGLKGEYTAAMLDEYRDLSIAYPLPPGDNFRGQILVQHGRLIDAVTLWLQRMGLVDQIKTEEAPKVGYRLTVNSPGVAIPLDLTSVGVGVSQILPTLVQALLAPVDSTLVFEQPELHLHPKVQSVLGDFFLAIALMGKQCLVETHSEHLINRLRNRIAQARLESVLPKIRIYFAEKEGAATRFREVKANEQGVIIEWPEGFFGQADAELSALLREQVKKHRWEMENRPVEGAG